MVSGTRLFRQVIRDDSFEHESFANYKSQAEKVSFVKQSRTLCILAIPTLKVDFQ